MRLGLDLDLKPWFWWVEGKPPRNTNPNHEPEHVLEAGLPGLCGFRNLRMGFHECYRSVTTGESTGGGILDCYWVGSLDLSFH